MACLPLVADDNSLDDAELWDFIDSTIARRTSFKPHPNPLLLTHHAHKQTLVSELPQSPQISYDSPEQIVVCKGNKWSSSCQINGLKHPHYVQPANSMEPATAPWIQPQKIARLEESSAIMHDNAKRCYARSRIPMNQIVAHHPSITSTLGFMERQKGNIKWPENDESRLSVGNPSEWMPNLPSASMFKHIQNAAMSVLEKGDYVVLQGKPFIKKSGWRKIAFFFNISFEIKDRTIQFDHSSNVQRAEFVVRASMQSGRFSDGWGSCDYGEKRFSKPNHDIPSTAETRAKTRACQDLLGIGEYKPGSAPW